MPVCTYTIHADSPDGPPLRFAVVGQPIFHKWSCDDCTFRVLSTCRALHARMSAQQQHSIAAQTGNIFKMKVVNCVVDDGQGQQLRVLDENGYVCSAKCTKRLSAQNNTQVLAGHTRAG